MKIAIFDAQALLLLAQPRGEKRIGNRVDIDAATHWRKRNAVRHSVGPLSRDKFHFAKIMPLILRRR